MMHFIYSHPLQLCQSEYYVAKLHDNYQPVAMIKAVDSGPGASKVLADDVGRLEP